MTSTNEKDCVNDCIWSILFSIHVWHYLSVIFIPLFDSIFISNPLFFLSFQLRLVATYEIDTKTFIYKTCLWWMKKRIWYLILHVSLLISSFQHTTKPICSVMHYEMKMKWKFVVMLLIFSLSKPTPIFQHKFLERYMFLVVGFINVNMMCFCC